MPVALLVPRIENLSGSSTAPELKPGRLVASVASLESNVKMVVTSFSNSLLYYSDRFLPLTSTEIFFLFGHRLTL